MPSRAATISGMLGIKNGVVTHGDRAQTLRGQRATLPQVLREYKIPAIAVSSFGRHPAPWFYVGWNEYFDPIDRPELSFQQIAGEVVVNRAIQWLKENREKKDFYLYVQLWDPHSAYEAPRSFVDAARNEFYPEYPTAAEISSHQDDQYWRSAPGMGIETHDDWKRMIDEYDGEIRYADHQVGRLLDVLQEVVPDDELLVILSADHGEEHGEHRLYMEHWGVHNGTQRIPLVIHDFRRKEEGRIHAGFVYQLDISATILEAFGIPIPPDWDSLSLLKQASTEVPERSYLVCGHGLYTAQRAVITRDWKLIRTYHPGLWEIPRIQLFRMDDVWERNDVAATHPEEVNRLDELLRTWEEEHRVGYDPMMVNAVEGPAGARGARNWTQRFQSDGVSASCVRPERKPEPND